jgi:hypothetical protein
MLVMAHSQFNRPNTWYSEPGNKNWCKEFEEVFKKVCQQVNTKLADDCPNKGKAFTIQTEGLVRASLPKFIGHIWKIRLMTLSTSRFGSESGKPQSEANPAAAGLSE